MDMIRMTGGLGNQMFQYALYLKLKSLGRDVKMDDKTQYERANPRPVMLWCFGISYPQASAEEIEVLTDGSLAFFHRVRRKIFGRKSLEYHEETWNFDPQVLEKTPVYLTGYFQSEKYFQDIEEQVRQSFQFSEKIWEGLDGDLENRVRGYRKKIEDSLAVSVHIRRGDYLDNEEAYGNICTEKYYQKAIELVRRRYPEAVFYFFSNDPAWVKKWVERVYAKELPFEIIEGTGEEYGYLDLFLMSRCNHHIIANSSFSWWGAWLSLGQPGAGEKMVIAPSKWHNRQDYRDIYTGEMIKITPEGQVLGDVAEETLGI